MRPRHLKWFAVVTILVGEAVPAAEPPSTTESPTPAVSTTTIAGRGYRSLDGMPVGIPGFGVPGQGPKRETPESLQAPARDAPNATP